jgi:hypothetical protein
VDHCLTVAKDVPTVEWAVSPVKFYQKSELIIVGYTRDELAIGVRVNSESTAPVPRVTQTSDIAALIKTGNVTIKNFWRLRSCGDWAPTISFAYYQNPGGLS